MPCLGFIDWLQDLKDALVRLGQQPVPEDVSLELYDDGFTTEEAANFIVGQRRVFEKCFRVADPKQDGFRDLSHGLVYPRSPTTGLSDEP
jgi:hypothetical protein